VLDQRRGQNYVADKGCLNKERGRSRSRHGQASKVACLCKLRYDGILTKQAAPYFVAQSLVRSQHDENNQGLLPSFTNVFCALNL
jgi:hypothetical protein